MEDKREIMKRLQVAVLGETENPEAASKTGLGCARRGFIVLTLSDEVGDAVKSGARMVNGTVVVFNGGKRKDDEVTIACHNPTDALIRAIESSDGVIVVGESEKANLAYKLSVRLNKPVAVVHSPEDSMAAVTKILESAVSLSL